jgi:L-seryl-tRNA(Ser) seleniumtransferase
VDIFEELGVTAYINANEWYTSQGGSMPAAPVIEAMAEASRRAVRLVELQNAVDGAIARLTGNEAACVTSSATAGIVLAVAALMAGLDAEKSERLPDTRGMKTEVIIQQCDRFGEDAAIRIPGARLVEIGDRRGASAQELQEAMTPQTAAVFTTPPREGMIPLDEIVRIAHESGAGVIVDIAWALPPKEHLWKFTREAGADVAIVSGGKGLRGPQASGLILGRKQVVEACRNMVPPHCRIGRPMKVGREAMAGVYAAVKHFLNGGAEKTQEMAQYIAGELAGIRGVTVRVDEAASHVHLQLSPTRFPLTRDQVKERLLGEEPRILVRNSGTHGIRVSAGTLSEGQEEIVARRLKEVLLGARE